jgi:hypothetical protein
MRGAVLIVYTVLPSTPPPTTLRDPGSATTPNEPQPDENLGN